MEQNQKKKGKVILKITGVLAVICLVMILFLGIALNNNRQTISKIYPEVAKAMTYEQYEQARAAQEEGGSGTVLSDKKEYKIQTTVKPIDGVTGGTISGLEDLVYETVRHGESNTKSIVMTPDENYELVSIKVNGEDKEFTPNEDGTYTIEAESLTNITEDIGIEVQFVLSSNKITIEKVSEKDNSVKVAGAKLLLERIPTEDDDTEYSVELEINSFGKAITSLPFGTYKITETEAPEGYKINEAIENIEFTEAGVHEFTITDPARPSVIVKHYLNDSEDSEGNKIEVAKEEIYYGDEGEDYTTSPKTNLKDYELLKNGEEVVLPEEASGKFGTGEKVVEYYYQLKEIALTVHYYKEGTTESVPLSTGNLAQDFITKGHKGDNYTTVPVENVSEMYELKETPRNAEGTYGDEEVVVIYYYTLREANISGTVGVTTENDKQYVVDGEKITYTITITNEGNLEKEITVKNSIPEGTTFVEGSIKIDEEVKVGMAAEDLASGIAITIPSKEDDEASTKTVSFEVTVNEGTTGVISNQAEVDGIKTNDTQLATLNAGTIIAKTTTQKTITSKDTKVYYEIEYNATIDSFEGNAEITIVDTLPYAINESESQLDGGEYDETYKTITWVVKEEGIDTFSSGEEKQITIRKNINVKYDYRNINEIEVSIVNNQPAGIITNEVESTIELQEINEESPDGYIVAATEDARDEETTEIKIPTEVVVHHYIYDEGNTTTKLVADETISGIIGQEYTTNKSSNVPGNFACVNEEPEKHAGKMTEETIEVNYYYELKTPTVTNDMEYTAITRKKKDGQTILTKEDETVTYIVEYTVNLKDYKGNAKAEIVATLPAGIDIDNSTKNKGVYNAESRTITWIETIENIDTFKNGDFTKKITKEIGLVYAGQDVTKDLINSVTGKIITYYPEVDTTLNPDAVLEDGTIIVVGSTVNRQSNEELIAREASAETSVVQEYKVHLKVEKEWDDNENAKGKRPESVTVDIGKIGSENTVSHVLNAGNSWKYEETDLPKYTEAGEKIVYTVTERETTAGDLEYYEPAQVNTVENQTDEETIYTITLTNEYKLMETNLGTVVTKTTSTNQITSVETMEDDAGKHDCASVGYTINVTGNVANYIGNGKVTIVDTLPYKINEAKSDLARGLYDDEKQTITWEEDLPHINTEKAGHSYEIAITKTLELVYKDIDLNEEKLTNNVTAKVELFEAEAEDHGEASVDTAINVKGKVIVKYLQEGTERELAEGYEIQEKIGTEYVAEKKEIENYNYVETSGNETGNIVKTDQVVIYYYKGIPTSVKVHYVEIVENDDNEEDVTLPDGKKGKDIIDPIVMDDHVGEAYQTEQKEIEKYRYIETVGEAQGEMTKEQIEVFYVYEKIPAKVIVRYLERVPKETDEENESAEKAKEIEYEEVEILEAKTINGYAGDNYEVSREAIKNYKAGEPEPENATGKMTEQDIEVKYYYEKMPSGVVTVKYVDEATNKEITYEEEQEDGTTEEKSYKYEIKGVTGEEYEAEEKEIPYYRLVKTTDNTKGELTEDADTIIYYYEKENFNFSIENTISNVSLNGEKVKITDDQLVKVEVPTKQVADTRLIVTYTIKVTNNGEIAGKAKIIEEIPEGYELVSTGSILLAQWEENKDGTMQTEVELEPEESKELEVILRWMNTERNLGSKGNIAKIVETENEANFEDTDEEDNTSTATVIVGIKTGIVVSIIITLLIVGSFVIAGYMIIITLNKMGKGPNIKGIKFLNR